MIFFKPDHLRFGDLDAWGPKVGVDLLIQPGRKLGQFWNTPSDCNCCWRLFIFNARLFSTYLYGVSHITFQVTEVQVTSVQVTSVQVPFNSPTSARTLHLQRNFKTSEVLSNLNRNFLISLNFPSVRFFLLYVTRCQFWPQLELDQVRVCDCGRIRTDGRNRTSLL